MQFPKSGDSRYEGMRETWRYTCWHGAARNLVAYLHDPGALGALMLGFAIAISAPAGGDDRSTAHLIPTVEAIEVLDCQLSKLLLQRVANMDGLDE